MDPRVLAPRACVKLAFIRIYLLLASTCYSQTDTSCTCGGVPIPLQPLTKPPDCSQMKDNRFRYTCIDGYVRKAGSSSLIRCENNKWTSYTLKCIENPLNPPRKTTPTSTRSPTSAVTPSISFTQTDLETTSTAPPPQHKTEGSLETTTLPQSSTNTPSAAPTSVPLITYSTSTISSPTTTHKKDNTTQMDRTTSPGSLSSSSTSSPEQRAGSVATTVITPVVILLIVLAAGGASFWLYKQRSRNRTHRPHTERRMSMEENVPMRQQNGDA